MQRTMMTAGLCLVMAGCGAAEAPPAAQASAAQASAAPPAGVAQAGDSARPAPGGRERPRLEGRLEGREGELVNPDDSTMVLLYFDVAGMTPPLDTWVEQDGRVAFAQGADKAAMRSTVRQELEAGIAGVQGVGRIRLSLQNANLSRYDPSYGEFTVGALAPSSVIRFSAFRQNVELKFGNGRTAQIWRVPPEEAQAIQDQVGTYGNNARLEVLLQITGVQPAMSGGSLVADILEFELRETRGGTTIGRVRLGD